MRAQVQRGPGARAEWSEPDSRAKGGSLCTARVAATPGGGTSGGCPFLGGSKLSAQDKGPCQVGRKWGAARVDDLSRGEAPRLSLHEAGNHLAPRRQVRGDYLAEPGPFTSSKTGSLLFPGSIVIF